MQYHVVYGDSLDELIRLVNQKLAQGWKLQGGVAAAVRPNGDAKFIQAVVR